MDVFRTLDEIIINGRPIKDILLDHYEYLRDYNKFPHPIKPSPFHIRDMSAHKRKIETYKRKLALHKKNLKKKADLTNVDFSNVDFQSIKLKEVDFKNANFKGANLRNATFECDFSAADFQGADIQNTDFSYSNLRASDLRNTVAVGTKFIGCELRGATFSKTKLKNCNFSKASLMNTNFASCEIENNEFSISELLKTNFIGTIIYNSTFQNAILKEAVFRQAKIFNSEFKDCNFSDSLLLGSYFENTSFSNSNLQGADLSDSKLMKCSLNGIILYRTIYFNWVLEQIECKYIFIDSDRTKRYPLNRDFDESEFEKLYKSLISIEIIFENGINLVDLISLSRLEIKSNEERPDFGLVLLSIDKRGIYPKATFSVATENKRIESETYIKEQFETIKIQYSELKNLLNAVADMIKDKPSKISIGNINVNGSNVFIPIQSPQSSFNIDAFTVEDLKSITDILKNTPEDVYIKAGKDKSVFIKVIKDLGKNIKEGALREVGKKLLEIGLFDLVPYLPLLQNILK